MSAQWPVEQAVIAALAADAAFAGIPVYVARAPQGTSGTYVVLGDASENAFRLFQRRGHEGIATIHIYAASKGVALTVYGAIERILDGALLAVTGHTHVRGRTTLITTLVDPDTSRHHAVARYAALTQVAA